MTDIHRKKLNSVKEKTMKIAFLCAAAFSLLAVMTIVVFLLVQGVPGIAKAGFFRFIFGRTWSPSAGDGGEYGVLNFIVGTLYVTACGVLLGGSLGVLTAVFISRFCPKFLRGVFMQLVNLLAAIPSIVYGMFGLVVIVPFLRETFNDLFGFGILPASIVLGMMILPVIVGLSKNALDAVPKSYYEGAVALGASHHEAVFKIVVPAAKSGIVSSIILGIGRAMGETMAVIMVIGNNGANLPTKLLQPIRTLTTNIVLEFGEAKGAMHTQMLIATGVVLLIFVLIINLSLTFFNRDREKRKTPKRRKPGQSDGGEAAR
ncbi:phosphate transport system permease protein [Clostridia bacterium]|nr:phosphate transport system permease protein [Clostridia bacterium]